MGEREKEMRVKLAAAENEKRAEQVRSERRGMSEEQSEVGREDGKAEQRQRRQAVREQVALAEQREERQAEERRVEVMREKEERAVRKEVELAKGLADDPVMMREEGIQKRLSEKAPYFQRFPTKQEDSETDKLKAAVRELEEKMGKLHDRVYVFEGAVEEKGTSSSEDEYGRDWRWESGSWFKIPAVRGVRVNARCRRKDSRSMMQVLEQEGWRNRDEKWNTWLKKRGRESLAMVGRRVSMTIV